MYLRAILAQASVRKKIKSNIKSLDISSLKDLFNIKDLDF